MRKLTSYLFYHIGNIVSKPMNKCPWLYPLYNMLMTTSHRIQGNTNKGPWIRCNGFCGEQECNENQKKNPNVCKRLNHKGINEIMDQVIRDHGHILKDIKD